MKIVVVRAPVREAMDQPRIAVIRKYDWFVGCEHRIEVAVRKRVRMFGWGLDRHQVHHINDADLDVRKVLAKQIDRRECLQSWNVPGAGHNDIWLRPLVSAGPFPNP